MELIIIWFGVDRYNRIFECTSAGRGNVPEFICKSKEEVDKLEDFFVKELRILNANKAILCEDCKFNQFVAECICLAKKGIYCFDACEDERHENDYKKVVEPVKPLFYEELPEKILCRIIE